MKKWVISKPDPEKAANINKKSDLSLLASEILVSRGYDSLEKASDFLSSNGLSSPFLLKDMEEAVDIINSAVDEEKTICIYGDYDCDGIASTVMLYQYLSCIGADVYYYIPERDMGYGLNEKIVRELCDDGVNLIITVDNGISAVNEASLIRELGMSLVITDHHQPSDILPEADAIVDPHRSDCTSPFKNLCGAGVVLKLIAAMDGGDYETVLEQFGDLAAIATIADVMKLEGENRYIVSTGLRYLANTENYGIQALMDKISLSPDRITATNIAFSLAPKINAAGRFASPKIAVELLLSEDPDEAERLAEELIGYNNARKDIEDEILRDINVSINSDPSVLNERVLVFAGKNWNHGVIGIVSAKITDRYGKPCIIISIEEDEARGSARSVGDFHIHGMLEHCSDVLTKYGGHIGAGGFSLMTADIDKFRKLVAEYARINHPNMPKQEIIADKILGKGDLSVDAIKSLSVLEPFGEGNPSPVFAILGAKVTNVIPLSEGKHSKAVVNHLGTSLQILMFNRTPESLPFKVNDEVNFLVSASVTLYGNSERVSIRMIDCFRRGIIQQKYFNASDAYEKYMLGEGVDEILIPHIKPDRNDMVSVYTAVSEKPRTFDDIYSETASDSINYFKFRIALDSFAELGLIGINHSDRTACRLPVTKKADLESSEILKKIRAL